MPRPPAAIPLLGDTAPEGPVLLDTTFDRVELIHDALTAVLASRAGCTVITEDRDFAAFARLDASLRVMFYNRR